MIKDKEVRDKIQSSVFIIIVVAWIILVLAVILFAATRTPLSKNDESKGDKYPKYFLLSISMSICIALGVLAGLAAGSVSGGIAIGIGSGLIIGQSLEKRYQGNMRPLTEREKQERLNRAGFGLVAICILVLATLITAILALLK